MSLDLPGIASMLNDRLAFDRRIRGGGIWVKDRESVIKLASFTLILRSIAKMPIGLRKSIDSRRECEPPARRRDRRCAPAAIPWHDGTKISTK